jgi:hypothetical protein
MAAAGMAAVITVAVGFMAAAGIADFLRAFRDFPTNHPFGLGWAGRYRPVTRL